MNLRGILRLSVFVLLVLSWQRSDAQTSLVRNGNCLCDPRSGLEWLALDQTAGLSYAHLLQDTRISSGRWRYATIDEVQALLRRYFGIADGQQGKDAEGYRKAVQFIRQMGVSHFNPVSQKFNVYAMTAAEGNLPPVVTIWYTARETSAYGWFSATYAHVDKAYQDPSVASFLVREISGNACGKADGP